MEPNEILVVFCGHWHRQGYSWRWKSVLRKLQGGNMTFKNLLAVCLLPSLLVACAATLRAADQFDVVLLQSNTSSQTVWHITQPNVKQASTSYPQIKFLPGDVVNVDAGGCVQTGGSGRSWKRYVDPSGPNADRFYHGKIWIPGVNNSLTRIKDFSAFRANRQIPAPLSAGLKSADLYLRLGYEDDNYGDNSYDKHDDGTEDQCKNSVNAFVVISIGHNGALPANPSQFVGIPPNLFRCQAAWAFHNFATTQLSNSTFNNAFNLNWYNYLDPTVEITFLAARGIASSGNCEGMSLLADVGEDEFVVGRLDESFWANYSANSSITSTDINTAHWKQLSVAFLQGYLGTVFQSPSQTAGQIEADLTRFNYNYGLLVLVHGGGGHVLVPLSVSRSGNQILIDVYDPNRPCRSIPDTAQYPKVVVTGDSWSYQMADFNGVADGTWTGSQSGIANTSGFAYIRYVGDDGWSDLGTNLVNAVQVIFGNGVNVDQVTDNTGKRFYVPNQPGVLDKSSQGLADSLVRVPLLGVDPYRHRPRKAGSKFNLNYAKNLTPAQAAQVQQIQSEYEADYGNSGQIFLAKSKQLSSLTFSLSGARPGQTVRMLVGQSGHSYEIKSVAATNAPSHPTLLIHNLGNIAEGVSVQSVDKGQLKVSVSHGLISPQANVITIQNTSEMTISAAPVRFSLTADKQLQLATTESLGQIKVTSRVIDKDAKVTIAPVRIVSLP